MAAKLYSIDNEKYVLGLAWHTVSDKSDIEGLLEARETEFGVILTDESNVPRMAGLAVAEEGEDAKFFSGEESAAVLLAGAESESVLLVEQLAEGLYWLCAVESGVVLMGTDIVVDEEQARRSVDDLLALSLFTIKGKGSESFGGDGSVFSTIIAGGVSDVNPEIAKLSPFPFKEYLLVGGGTIFIVGLVFIIYIKLIHPWIFPPSVDITQSEREALERRKAVARQEVAKSLQSDLMQPSVSTYWSAVYKDMKKLKAMDVNGWRLDKLDCQVASCFYVWDNSHASSQMPITEVTQNHCPLNIMPQGEAAQCMKPMNIERRETLDVNNENFIDEYQLREQMLTLTRLGLKTNISRASLYTGMLDSQLLEENELYLRGKWQVKGPLVVFPETSTRLSRNFLRTFWVEHFVVECSSAKHCGFTVGGAYVGKK